MIRTILVPATGSDADSASFATALALARKADAHITFLHVRPDRPGIEAAMAVAGSGAVMVPGQFIEQAEAEADMRASRAKDQVFGFCMHAQLSMAGAPSGMVEISAEWCLENGDERAAIVAYGQISDLLVLGRRGTASDLAPGTLEAALFETGRPILIPASASRELRTDTVVIAWKPTAPAARAVTAAMPLLEKANRVAVLTVSETDDAAAESAERLASMLTWHGIHATTDRLAERERSNAAETLFAAAVEREAGLVVMGGFGHSRAREYIFGGFTEQVLREASLPLFLCH
jgi:nucleotide-binding universal stress UspA family protein